MSTATTTHAICRLLGGSGRAPLILVPTPKLPALLAPTRPLPAATCVIPIHLPLAA